MQDYYAFLLEHQQQQQQESILETSQHDQHQHQHHHQKSKNNKRRRIEYKETEKHGRNTNLLPQKHNLGNQINVKRIAT